MQEYKTIGELLTGIGNAIRTKKGTSEKINAQNMPSEIESIESGGGAELNIHYGETAPEDTSKLWLKCNQPSKVEIKNTIEGGEESIKLLTTTLPYSYADIASAIVGTKVYLFGGSGNYSAIRVFDTKTNTIETLSVTLPHGSSSIASAVIGTKVYLFGGTQSNTAGIKVFDTKTNTIETLSVNLPTTTTSMVSAVVGTKVYLFGGYTDKYLDTIRVFNTETNVLTTLTTKLPIATYDIASAVIGTKVYLFGGYRYNVGQNSTNLICLFDTETNTIETLSVTLPSKAGGIASAIVGTKVYLFGGNALSDYDNFLNTINVFDTETNTIETLSVTLPSKISDMTSVIIGTKVYLFGGKGASSSYFNSIYCFSVGFDINSGTLFLLNQGDKKVSIVKGDNVDVEIAVKMALLGNANNEGESVPFAIHNGNEWVSG